MKKSIIKKRCSLITGIAFSLLFVFCTNSQAQNNSNTQKYIRIDIGHGALHCPFLSPKLETQLKQIEGVENFFLDRQTSYLTFNLPANTKITVDSLKQIGIAVGYPGDDVMVKMDDKPIVITTKQ